MTDMVDNNTETVETTTLEDVATAKPLIEWQEMVPRVDYDQVCRDLTEKIETLADVRAAVTQLTRVNEEQEERITRLVRGTENLVHDLTLLIDTAYEQAEERDWCETYERLCDKLNAKFRSGYEMRKRVETVTLSWLVTVEAEIAYGTDEGDVRDHFEYKLNRVDDDHEFNEVTLSVDRR